MMVTQIAVAQDTLPGMAAERRGQPRAEKRRVTHRWDLTTEFLYCDTFQSAANLGAAGL